MDTLMEIAGRSKAWPFEEARKIAARNISGRPTVFQTGYGPSGLPHIGTFAEVARTSMVRRAYEILTGNPTRLIVFSDDMDALRKVPDNVPNGDMLKAYIGTSLSRVPDPFETHASFAAHNNAMLRQFLDLFGFQYEFISSTDMYQSGVFNDTLTLFARNHERIRSIITPTLGPDRRETYSPFMPIDTNGVVHAEGVHNVRDDGTLQMRITDNGSVVYSYLNGGAKLQWKADWAMRWIAGQVDYEMSGKDLIDSVKLSTAIVRALGFEPPVSMTYEMFLDEDGHKISKSIGNGLTIEDWLTYGSEDSLRYFLFQNPKKARALGKSVIARAEDDYLDALRRYPEQDWDNRLGNAVFYIHGDQPPTPVSGLSYGLLLNIAATAVPASPNVLWRYVERYIDGATPETHPELNQMVLGAYFYYWDVLSHTVNKREATPDERSAFQDLASRIEMLAPEASEEAIQFEVYEVGKLIYGKERLRDWFKALYEVLLGQSSGPRFGAFTLLFGREETVELLRSV